VKIKLGLVLAVTSSYLPHCHVQLHWKQTRKKISKLAS